MSTDLTLPPEQDEIDEFELYLPQAWIKYYRKIPPNYFQVSEQELATIAYGPNGHPDCKVRDDQLREVFWELHNDAVKWKRRIRADHVTQGIMASSSFRVQILYNYKRLAWILYPPGSYLAQNAVSLRKIQGKIDEVIALPVVVKECRCHYGCVCEPPGWKGEKVFDRPPCSCKPTCICPERPNVKLIDTLVKLRDQMERRAHGSIPQVQKVLSMNLHQHQQLPTPEKSELPTDVVEVNKRLAALKYLEESDILSPGQSQVEIVEAQILEKEPDK